MISKNVVHATDWSSSNEHAWLNVEMRISRNSYWCGEEKMRCYTYIEISYTTKMECDRYSVLLRWMLDEKFSVCYAYHQFCSRCFPMCSSSRPRSSLRLLHQTQSQHDQHANESLPNPANDARMKNMLNCIDCQGFYASVQMYFRTDY